MNTKIAAFLAAFLLLAIGSLAFGREPGLLIKRDIRFGPAVGGSPAVIRAMGNPAAGFIAFRTGKNELEPGLMMTIRFPVPYPHRPMCDFHLSGGKDAIQLSVPVTTVKAAVSTNVALAPSTTYQVSYSCMF